MVAFPYFVLKVRMVARAGKVNSGKGNMKADAEENGMTLM